MHDAVCMCVIECFGHLEQYRYDLEVSRAAKALPGIVRWALRSWRS